MYILKGINCLLGEESILGNNLFVKITGETSQMLTFELEEATRFETKEEIEKVWKNRLEDAVFESYEIIEEEL